MFPEKNLCPLPEQLPELGQEQALDVNIWAQVCAVLRGDNQAAQLDKPPAQLSWHWEVSQVVKNQSYELTAKCSWGQEEFGVQSVQSRCSAGLWRQNRAQAQGALQGAPGFVWASVPKQASEASAGRGNDTVYILKQLQRRRKLPFINFP